jgi:(1->4)-alpha-D-glucan 1-alpha-D-glucosylmutase
MTTPRATYRLQLHAGFTFDDAAAAVPYLAALGVSHVYCSPYLQAARGSTHGYDVVDHSRVNEELGGDAAYRRFVTTLKAHGLGQVVDIVPNHMAITSENGWWVDVLENGPSSHFASYFDVEWDPPEARLRNMVLLPVLGDHYGRALEAGEIRVSREGARFRIHYGEHAFPVGPRSLGRLLRPAAQRRGSVLMAFLADAFSELPRATATDRVSVTRRHRDKHALHTQLERLLVEEPATAAALDGVLAEVNGDPDALHALLEGQNYRLAWWRSAGHDLGYRRFFDVNTLAGLRMEDEQVFEDTHALVLRLVHEGVIDGLRVDHPDGLRDPQQYLERLRHAAPEAWIVVEKILEPGEALPDDWPVEGTTGYDFLNRVLGLFVDPAGEAPLTQAYAELTGETTDYARLVRDKKLLVLRDVLGSDVNRLVGLLVEVCERHRRHRDYTRHHLADALRELIAAFPVYRSYVRPLAGRVSDDDRAVVAEAVAAATREAPVEEGPLLAFLGELLTLEIQGTLEAEFVARFQQLTGPAMAKGLEDTAFYAFNRFVALNEVGGDPSRLGLDVAAFHAAMAVAQARWPHAMLSTATHDTKRGEDVRARLALLSERPVAWGEAVRGWHAAAARHRTGGWPDANAEYFFWQTLVGAWPIDADRLRAYMEKATREAKAHTSWTSPNEAYDRGLAAFVDGVLGDAALMDDVRAFVAPLVGPGRVNALAQLLVKLTAPGVPDLYQGSETWALHLVDPDNRRPVDYDERRRLLAACDPGDVAAVQAGADVGLPKMWVTRQALHLRAQRPAAFGPAGAYAPLDVHGPKAGHVVAFSRGGEVLTVVPRLVLGACGQWGATSVAVPEGRWIDVLTGATHEGGPVPVAALWSAFPVALLARDAGGG